MHLSEIHYQQFASACRLGKSSKVLTRLWHRWQDALIAEGKFHTKGKKVVVLAW